MPTRPPTRNRAPHPGWVLVALALAAPARLAGTPVAVGDPGFEGNSLASGGWTYDLSPEWSETNGPGSTSGFEECITGFAAEGTDHLGMENDHDVWQDLAATYQPATLYTLTVAVGNRPGSTSAGNLSRYALADPAATVHASAEFDASTRASLTFADAPPLALNTTTHPAAVGQPIRVLLQARGTGRSHFDFVRLEATSLQPPGTATLISQPATAVTATSATLNATVTAIGDGAPTVTFFFGTTDGGPAPDAWNRSVTPAGTHSGPVAAPIAGLAPANVYFFTARATNSAGDSWSTPSQSFETLPLPPAVATLPPASVGATSATLGAEVLATGGDIPQVTLYYGTTDGGTNPLAWQHSVTLGPVPTQATSTVTGLAPSTPHYCRAHAANGGGAAWATTTATFTTTAVSPPAVSNRSPTGITGTTATLRGEIDATGGDPPAVTMFYGPSDGGINPNNWARQANLGTQDDNFSIFVRELLPNTNYWFRCRATNAAGTAWAGDSDFFRTTGLVPSGVVINEIHYDPDDESTPGEFIELHNPGDRPANLAGWSLTDAVQFTFPAGTTLAAGAFLVVAQDPATILATCGVAALGPWTGRLDNDGEQLDLRDDADAIRDQVSYGAGFPWPTGPRGGGGSAELINPALDNDLGGSWRDSSRASAQPPTTLVPAADPGWRFRKGTSEPSSPVSAWRLPSFTEDATWATGHTPVGFGDGDDNTELPDMPGAYTSVYLRHTFTLNPAAIPIALTLRVYVDDGAVVWINGTEVARLHAPPGELTATATGVNHEAAWEEVPIPNPGLFLVGGSNVLAIHALNTRIDSTDFSIDAELIDPGATVATPSPGAPNHAFASTAPPQIRQVAHHPASPTAGVPVTVTAKLTDPEGIGPVTLLYQTVDPGAYVRKTDAAYAANWSGIPMTDDGSGNDALAGDFIFTATVPAAVQTHRRLVRYRITFADAAGTAATVPYPDDAQANFAWFVYDGPPPWTGSLAPGGPTTTFPATLLDDLPVCHLVANQTDVVNCQYNAGSDGVHMLGTLVYDGVVHDHIEFENRGEASTYASGKNKWRFHFNRARALRARDHLGHLCPSGWNRLNLEGCSSPWAAVHRGMAGVEEALSYRLYQLCGVPSPRTHHLHFRVVDNPLEADPASQYEGDLWGLYLAVEQPDGSFLNDRGLPDGNVYKIEGGAGDKKEQGLGQPADSSDWNSFYAASNSTQSEEWWRQNMDMPAYYSFRACNRICGNVDLRDGYNHYFYHHPDGRWVPMPWDLDMMFIAETHWAGHIRQQNALSHPALALEFRNRARELLDLVCSDAAPDGGQIGQLVAEYARIVNPAGQHPTWADLDAHLWNHHPRTAGDPASHSGQTNHKGNFFYTPFADSRIGGTWTRTLASPDHEGSMRYLLDYATDTFPGGTWAAGNGNQYGYGHQYLKQEAADTEIPNRPTAAGAGAAHFPVNDLRFSSSPFADPQGAGTFAALRWRIAEISSPGAPGFDPAAGPQYEVETTWDSGELTPFVATIQIPAAVVRPDHTYRVRVRHKDNTGRWSHWSPPVEFLAAAADLSVWQDNLVVSEVMYNPPEPAGADETAVSTENDDYEFLELRNVSPTLTLGLSDLRFSDGVTFSFAGSAVTSLGPGEFALVVRHAAAFAARYGTGLPVAGEYTGNLSNGGEQVTLSFALGEPIHDFAYSDLPPWPAAADGPGYALVLVDPASVPDHSSPSSWTAGNVVGGTPGAPEPPAPGTWQAWQAAHFSGLELLDPAVSGRDADPDGDGRSNMLEYAFATNPLADDAPTLAFARVAAGSLRYPAIRFHRPEDAADLVYQLEASDDLAAWQVLPSVPVTEETLGGGVEQALLRDNLPDAGRPRRFLRVRVTTAP